MRRRLARYLPWVLIAVCALSGRLLIESRSALHAGRDALLRGEVDEGIFALRRAAHLYLPGSPYVRDAYDELERVARDSETRGLPERALTAWRAVRASALSTRWLASPYEARLRSANQHIAHLMAQQPAAPDERDRSPRAREERHLTLLGEDRAPEPAWKVVLGVGLALWLMGMLHAARAGWDDDDRAQRGPLAAAGALGGVGAALLLLALWRA